MLFYRRKLPMTLCSWPNGMPTSSRPTGVRVTTSEALTITEPVGDSTPRRRGRSGRLFGPVPISPAAPTAEGSEHADLIAAFAEQEMTVVDEVELQPAPTVTSATRRGVAPEVERASVEVDLGAGEEAVVLLEQDGFYSWNFPTSTKPAEPKTTRARRSLPAGKTAHFELEFHSAPPATPQKRGFVQDFLMSKARAVVLKFVAHVAVDLGMKHLERNVRRGLVIMDSNEPQTWRLVENISALKLPHDRPARLLLFVHGTFSTTLGSFGGLGATPWGRAFLEAARANYDAVIGFDHATLSDDPLENASDLLQRLQLATLPHPPRARRNQLQPRRPCSAQLARKPAPVRVAETGDRTRDFRRGSKRRHVAREA